MRLRLNIVFSLVAHASIIIAAFTIGRGWTSRDPANPLTVSLVSGLPEIKVLNAQDQKKQASHSHVSSDRNTAVSSPHDSGAVVKDKTSTEAVRDETDIISYAREDNTEDRTQKESLDAKIGPSGSLNNARGVPSSSPSVGYQGLPAGISASGDLVHEQAKTQPKGINAEDGKAIRKAIEKALIYPLLAKKRGIEGTVLTEFTISSSGYPENIRIVRSSGYGILDAAARDTVLKASPFAAARGTIEIPITFRIKNN